MRLTLTKPDNAPIVLSSDVDFISAQNSDQNVYMNITRPEGYTGYSLSLYLRPGTDHTPTEFALNMGNLFVLPKRFLTYLRIFISVGFKNSDGSLVTNSNEIFFKVFPSNAGMVSASPIDDLAFVKVEVADGNINFYNVYGDLMDSAPISAGALPAGGTVGQVLTKVGSADYEVDWADTSDASDSVVYDNNDDIRPRSNIIMSAGKQIYGLDAAGITHPLLATNTYDVGLPSERIQNEFGSKGYHASIQSDDRPTVDTASGQESVAYVSDIDGKNAKYETAIGEPSVSTDPVPLTSTNVSDALDELTERGQININSIAAANSKISDLQDAIDGISANQLTGAEFTRVINGTTDLAANLFSTFSLVADKTFFYDVNGTLAVYRKTENNLASFTTMTIASLGDDEPTLLGNVNGEDSTALPQTTSAAQTVFGRSVSIDDYAKLIKSNGTVMEYYITSIDTTSGNITWGNEITINTSDYQAQTTAGDSGKVLTGGATAGSDLGFTVIFLGCKTNARA